MQPRSRQGGLSLGGFVFVAAVGLTVAMVGFRVTPAYIEYYAVKQALGESLRDARDPTVTADIRRAFQKRVDTGYIESVGGQDIEISKEGNDVVASVAWTRTLHLVANASLLLDFEATATR